MLKATLKHLWWLFAIGITATGSLIAQSPSIGGAGTYDASTYKDFYWWSIYGSNLSTGDSAVDVGALLVETHNFPEVEGITPPPVIIYFRTWGLWWEYPLTTYPEYQSASQINFYFYGYDEVFSYEPLWDIRRVGDLRLVVKDVNTGLESNLTSPIGYIPWDTGNYPFEN